MRAAPRNCRGVVRRRRCYRARVKTKTPSIPRQWTWHHRALVRLGHVLASESGARLDAVRVGLERGGTDSGEVANDEAEHGTLLAEIRQERTELAEIEAALERLRAGSYGICEATGASIEPERLRALPWTRLGATAAATRERSIKARAQA